MAIFNSYLSLPEGTDLGPLWYPSLGPRFPTPEWSRQAGCQSRWRKPHATGPWCGKLPNVSSIEMLVWVKTKLPNTWKDVYIIYNNKKERKKGRKEEIKKYIYIHCKYTLVFCCPYSGCWKRWFRNTLMQIRYIHMCCTLLYVHETHDVAIC